MRASHPEGKYEGTAFLNALSALHQVHFIRFERVNMAMQLQYKF